MSSINSIENNTTEQKALEEIQHESEVQPNKIKIWYILLPILVIVGIGYWYWQVQYSNTTSSNTNLSISPTIAVASEGNLKDSSLELDSFKTKVEESLVDIAFGGEEVKEAEKKSIAEAIADELNGNTQTTSLPAEEPINSTPPTEPTKSESSDLLDPSEAVINTINFFTEAELMDISQEVGHLERYAFSVDVGHNNGTGEFQKNIWLKIVKNIDGRKETVNYITIKGTGKYAVSIFRDILNPYENPELKYAKNLTFSFESDEFPNINKSVTYKFKNKFSQPGNGTLHVSVASTVSGPGALDRVMVYGATVKVYKNGSQTPSFTTKTGPGGFVKILDVAPGGYLVTAEYNGKVSQRDPITLVSDEQSGGKEQGLFVTVPVKPATVIIPPGKAIGRITYHDTSKSNYLGVPSVKVSIYKGAWQNRTNGTIVGTTITDINGNYFFDSLPGDSYYYVEYELPAGWKEYYSPEPFILLGGATEKNWTIILPQ